MADTRKVVIIGSGSAGYTAAIYAARAELQPLLFAGVNMGGQLMITSDVENFPGFPEPVMGPELMDRMRKQVDRLGVEVVQENVASVDLRSGSPFSVETTSGRKEVARTLIIATGAQAKWLGLESEKKMMGKGVSACATCDGFFFKGKELAVVGGGDSAMEEATFLTKFAPKVTVIHRRDSLRASKIMQQRAKDNPKIDFLWDSAVEEVLGSDSVEGLRLKNLKSGKLSEFKCQGLFVAIGHKPTTDFLGGQLKTDDAGYIETDRQLRTSVEGVFAAGDVTDKRYRQAITAAGMGCMAALEVEHYLSTQG